MVITAADCQTAGGSFLGGDCAPALCPLSQGFGACCVNYVCFLQTPGDVCLPWRHVLR